MPSSPVGSYLHHLQTSIYAVISYRQLSTSSADVYLCHRLLQAAIYIICGRLSMPSSPTGSYLHHLRTSIYAIVSYRQLSTSSADVYLCHRLLLMTFASKMVFFACWMTCCASSPHAERPEASPSMGTRKEPHHHNTLYIMVEKEAAGVPHVSQDPSKVRIEATTAATAHVLVSTDTSDGGRGVDVLIKCEPDTSAEGRSELQEENENNTTTEYNSDDEGGDSEGMIRFNPSESELESDGRSKFTLAMMNKEGAGGTTQSEGWVNYQPENVNYDDEEPEAEEEGGEEGEGGGGDDTRRVDGFALNVEGWEPEVVVRGHFQPTEELQTNLSASTLCFWLHPTRWYNFNFLIGDGGFQMYIDDGKLTAAKYNVFYLLFEAVVELRSWFHVCYVIHSRGYDMYFEGQPSPVTTSYNASQNITSYVFNGQNQVLLSSSSKMYYYCGYMADIRFFPWWLSQEEVNRVRNGDITGSLATKGSALIITNITTVNPNITVLRKFSYKELLKPKENHTGVYLIYEASYMETMQLCQSFGGEMFDIEDKDRLHDQCTFNTDYDIADVWVRSPEVNVFNITDESLCNIVTKQGLIYASMKWPCGGKAYVVCCKVSKNITIRLKGDLHLTDNRLLPVHDYENPDGLTLEGVGRLRVSWNKSEAVIQTNGYSSLFRSVFHDKRLIGRGTWFDANDREVTLTLSHCQTGEFTCNNGQCVNLTKRCNGVPLECDDYSDDDDSCWMFKGPPTYYFKQQPPQNPLVNLSINLARYRDVMLDKNLLQIVMVIKLSWRDERLTFHNLLPPTSQAVNQLHEAVLNNLWHPSIFFPKALFEDNLSIKAGNATHKRVLLFAEKPGIPSQHESYEALEYRGHDVILEVEEAMLLSNDCQFDPLAFPFDVQLCVVPVEVVGNSPQVAKQFLRAYSQTMTLPVYRCRPIRCTYNKSQERVTLVEVAVLLERRNEAYLLSALGPCLVLGLLGHLSFVAFSINEFNERASTALSLLIVVAALFSQSVSTLPSSASPKAIDVWFFYFILRFFLFFVFHCLVEFQRRRYRRSTGKIAQGNNAITPQQQQHDDYDSENHLDKFPAKTSLVRLSRDDDNTVKDDKFPAKIFLARSTLMEKKVSDAASPHWHLSSSQVSEDEDFTNTHQSSPSKIHHYISTPHHHHHHHQQRRRHELPSSFLDHVTPWKVNVASLVVGVLMDVLFVLAFYCYLQVMRNDVLKRFYDFDDCSMPS
ncbi:hypothetical protein Pmani_003302 [Petrolisthes manimaculis]|uniref:Uncharacterized protein n=1 Tax=Petrolisthes manimaculis TaxID=1843537 RepID=A0AAE1QGV6_9EUCA|nr:hypothetical protein Pmani_003302 [Petrolisthes manimaculis]